MTNDNAPFPLRRIAVVFAILSLAAFAYPGGLVAWLDERDAGGRLAVPLAMARGIDAASAAVGVKGLGVAIRKYVAPYLSGEDN